MREYLYHWYPIAHPEVVQVASNAGLGPDPSPTFTSAYIRTLSTWRPMRPCLDAAGLSMHKDGTRRPVTLTNLA